MNKSPPRECVFSPAKRARTKDVVAFLWFHPRFFSNVRRFDSRLGPFNRGTQSASVRYMRATTLSKAMRYSSVIKLPKAAFVAASLLFAGGVFAVAGQAGATVNNALPASRASILNKRVPRPRARCRPKRFGGGPPQRCGGLGPRQLVAAPSPCFLQRMRAQNQRRTAPPATFQVCSAEASEEQSPAAQLDRRRRRFRRVGRGDQQRCHRHCRDHPADSRSDRR